MSPDARNLVLITIDAWRDDFAEAFGGVPLVPALAPLRDRTARIAHAYANGPWTTPPLISLFTGESPARHGVHFEWSAPRPGTPALPRALAAAGYAVPNLCYLNRVGNYQGLGYVAAESPDYPHDADDDTLVRAIQAARRAPRPSFLWYHYKFVHLPYWAAPHYRALFAIDEGAVPQRLKESVCTGFVVPRHQFHLLPEDRPLVQRLYAAGVRQMDAWLQRVLGEIFADPAFAARTTVVLSADHGDELLEHGHVGHASTAHHATLFEEVLRVPLFVIDERLRAPGAARTYPVRAQSMDLYPTLLTLALGPAAAPLVAAARAHGAEDLAPLLLDGAGPPDPGREFYFHSSRQGYLTPRAQQDHFIAAISDGRRKIVHERYDAEEVRIYDLAADPGEQAPLVAEGAAAAAALAEIDEVRARLAG